MRRAGRRAIAIALAVAAGVVSLSLISLSRGAPSPADELRTAYSGPQDQWPAPTLDADAHFLPFGRFYPVSSPRTDGNRERVELGQRLFTDPALSASGLLSCASCHDPATGLTVRSPVATGHAGIRGKRNPLALYDTPHRPSFAWDGGSRNLEERVTSPLTDPTEMGNAAMADVLGRIADDPGYSTALQQAFGTPQPDTANIAQALVAYLEAQESESRFDRFLAGDSQAFSDIEIRGLHLFRTKARCANCHSGPRLTDDLFHNLRLSSFREPAEDLGRYRITGKPEDIGRFQTPSLRHVGKTAPYMHNGLIETLEGVVHFYARGGGEVWARNAREAADPQYPFAAALSPHIKQLHLDAEERAALVAFLKTL